MRPTCRVEQPAMRTALLGLGTLLCLSGCGSSEPSAAEAPNRWHVAGGALRDPEGRAVILRGVNLAGAHKQAPYFGFHQPEDFNRLSNDWGLNHVRFLLLWAGIEPKKGEYSDAYLDEVALRMDWAASAGLSVVLDMHQDVYGEGFNGDGAPRWTCDESHYQKFTPTTPWFMNYLDPEVVACVDQFWTGPELRGHYQEAWRRVAKRLGGHPAVIGFDPMNEPFWGSHSTLTFDAEVLQPFYEDLTRAIRADAPKWVAFLEPFAGRNLGFATSLTPFSVRDVVYSPHAYDPDAESGKGFEPKKRAAFIGRIAALRADADALGAPLWLGEYGGMADSPGIEPYVDAAYDGAAAVAAGSAYWAYDKSDGYGLLAPDGSEKPQVLAQVVRPYPERVAGDLLDWEWDEAALRLRVRLRPDSRVGAPTVIRVPPRIYPKGYQISCGGCATEVLAGEARLRDVPGGDPAVIELAP
ncbi:MAG: cellulase family glycosylhydrolase [Polyangiaceae bacterium]|nr:cellulase family glycosylhydrolase [Polyangiaceae bacterium]